MKDEALQARTCDILGIRFDLTTYNAVMETIERWRINGKSHYVTLTNPYCVTLCHRDTKMLKAIEMAGMTLPDGTGIVLAAKLLGYPHNGRVTGPTLMLKLCDWGRKYGYRHYFYGGAEGVNDRLAERLSNMYPGLEVAGTYSPPFRPLTEEEDKDIVEKINSTNPDIVWVGLGAPKQEKWMCQHLGQIKAPAMIGVGAAFDFHSGKVKWAPNWLRKLGFEWLYRVILEPRRMAPKAKDTLVFVVRVLAFWVKQKFGIAKS